MNRLLMVGALAVALSGYALFAISYRVEALENRLREARNDIHQREQAQIHVLKAEWAYLSNPATVEALARRLIPTLRPLSAGQYLFLEEIPFRNGGAAPEARP